MKLMTERCCAANDSMFLLPSWSVSPNAYCALLVENKMRASAKVIQPCSSGGNADKERASVASVVLSGFVASGGTAASAPKQHSDKAPYSHPGSFLPLQPIIAPLADLPAKNAFKHGRYSAESIGRSL